MIVMVVKGEHALRLRGLRRLERCGGPPERSGGAAALPIMLFTSNYLLYMYRLSIIYYLLSIIYFLRPNGVEAPRPTYY